MRTKYQAAAFFASLACCGAAKSAVFCVDSEDALTQALADAESNGEDNDIRLRTNVYTAPAGGWRIDLHDATRSFAITGGYLDAQCTARTAKAAATVLDGGSAERILTIDTSESFGVPNAAVSIEVVGITFVDARAENVSALKISDPGPIFGGIIRVEGDAFLDNTTEGALQDLREEAPALLLATDGPDTTGGTGIFLSNNLFGRNTGANAAAVYAFTNNHIDVTGNTFVDNASTDMSLDERVTFDAFAIGGITLSNNIFWDNNRAMAPATFDIHFDGRWTSDHNDVQAGEGTPANSTADLNVDPEFVASSVPTYELTGSSPLLDRGNDQPIGGLEAFDIAGHPRISGQHVDIGAFEYAPTGNVIFDNDFEIVSP